MVAYSTSMQNGNVMQGHPCLVFSKAEVLKIKAELGKVPLFDKTVAKVKAEVDKEISRGIDVPTPKDMAGGYTHERHKRNFIILRKAGILFQLLGDVKYAKYIKGMLLEYATIYKELPIHPQERSYARGKIFWQCLNDANWLVYVSQAYDCIYEWLATEERQNVENNLFRPFADFISTTNPQFFNRIHNHSTWGNAAVGMIGLVMQDSVLLRRALYGIQDNYDHLLGRKDDDGGFIKVANQKAGFLANLEEAFSPDGYYTEGPYYQRYAMYPFMIFAQALHNVQPQLRIFDFKDSMLVKSVHTLLNLTDAAGHFFPINDGQKGMSYFSRELVTAVDIAYHFGGKNPALLSIAKKQDRVTLDYAGMSVALGLREHKETPFIKKSLNLRDGKNGKDGGLAILRYGEDEDLTLAFKYTAQGLSHGHYDKLSFSLYSKADEVIQDYGLARFVNIEQKNGGGYLKENTTWAKQTIAHNTIVQNGISHFQAKYELGSKHSSDLYFFDNSNKHIQIVSAEENNAYPGTRMLRTMALIKVEDTHYKKPFILDIIMVQSTTKNRYDLPFYYMGQMIETNVKYQTPSTLKAMGNSFGYQHLWVEGMGVPSSGNTTFTFLNQDKMYTITSAASSEDSIFFARMGANDPDFNLRRDPTLIIRREGALQTLFLNAIEPHGTYSRVSEFAVDAFSKISQLKVLHDTKEYTAVSFKYATKENILIISNSQNQTDYKHQLKINSTSYNWVGPYFFKSKN